MQGIWSAGSGYHCFVSGGAPSPGRLSLSRKGWCQRRGTRKRSRRAGSWPQDFIGFASPPRSPTFLRNNSVGRYSCSHKRQKQIPFRGSEISTGWITSIFHKIAKITTKKNSTIWRSKYTSKAVSCAILQLEKQQGFIVKRAVVRVALEIKYKRRDFILPFSMRICSRQSSRTVNPVFPWSQALKYLSIGTMALWWHYHSALCGKLLGGIQPGKAT